MNAQASQPKPALTVRFIGPVISSRILDPSLRGDCLNALRQSVARDLFLGKLSRSVIWRNVVALAFDFSSDQRAEVANALHEAFPFLRSTARFERHSFGAFCGGRPEHLARVPSHLLADDADFLRALSQCLHWKRDAPWTIEPRFVSEALLCARYSPTDCVIHRGIWTYRPSHTALFAHALTERVFLCRTDAGSTALHLHLPEGLPERIFTPATLLATNADGATALERINERGQLQMIPRQALAGLLEHVATQRKDIREIVEKATVTSQVPRAVSLRHVARAT